MEQGTHQELLALEGQYAKLVKHGGEPEIKPEMKDLPKWMHPKATPIVHVYEPPVHASKEYTVLANGTQPPINCSVVAHQYPYSCTEAE